MKSLMLAGVAMLSFSAFGTVAGAQDRAPSADAQPPADAQTSPVDPAMPAPPATPPVPDPNAGQPTGAVPADTGMVPAPPGVPRDPAAPVGSAANPVTVGGNMTPPPAEAKDYPVCSRTVQDSCVNRGEAKATRTR